MLSVPVALLVFNRPALTRNVFRVISQVKPKQLLVVADGPRSSEEATKCAATRAVVEQVDWDCDVLTNYSDVNLGCKRRVSSGLDWVFDQCEEAIILEDDCLPDATFFPYCEELLSTYRDVQSMMHIGGANFQFGIKRDQASYYFSRFAHVWGWASWRRAWRNYDVSMDEWPTLRAEGWLRSLWEDPRAVTYWTNVFDAVHAGRIDTWDYQWLFAVWKNNGLAAVPQVNLVSNLGFGPGATHTIDTNSSFSRMAVKPMRPPLRHPAKIAVDYAADQFVLKNQFLDDRSDTDKWRQWRVRTRRLISNAKAKLLPAN